MDTDIRARRLTAIRAGLFLLAVVSGLAGCRAPAHIAAPVPKPPRPTERTPGPVLRAVPEAGLREPGSSGSRPSWYVVGYSVENREIEAVQLGRGPLRVLIIGSVHGNEPEGIALVDRLLQNLTRQPKLLQDATVVLIRNANPDGAVRGRRTNARGVDINRNFPASNWQRIVHPTRGSSGEHPLSEPESRVIWRIVDHFRPHRIVAIHSTVGEPMVNYDGPARDLAERMSQFNGYPVRSSIGYPTPGSLGNYAGNDLQIPIITLELPRGIDPLSAWQQNRDALLSVLMP